MDFQPLKLEHKPIFDRMFSRAQSDNSWFTFVNLFIWQDAYHPEWALEDDCLFITLSRHGIFYAFPPFIPSEQDFPAAVNKLVNYFDFRGLPFLLKGLSAPLAELLTAHQAGRFTATPRRDRYDYVYLTTDLAELNGRKYHSKRNHITNFSALNPDWRYGKLTPSRIPECLEIATLWCAHRECAIYPDLALEYQAIQLAFANYEALGLQGGVILVNNKVQAFTFGEKLNKEMTVIHIEKANPRIDGLYAIINKEFCLNAWQDVTYINREEDLGIHGLRKAKESYFPVKLIEKYDITLHE